MDQIEISGNPGFKFTSQVKQRCGSPTMREGVTAQSCPPSWSGYRNVTCGFRIKTSIAIMVLALGCLGSSASQQESSIPQRSEKSTVLLAVGDMAPDWKLSDPEGRVHCLSEYRGRVVVMDFWATWCGPCTQMMPRLQRLHEKYKEQGALVFGINAWETSDPVALMRKKRFTYPVLLKGETLAQSYGVSILPTIYIIGADGKVIYRHEGVGEKNLAKLIEQHR